MLLWLKEAQPHVLGHPGAFTGSHSRGSLGAPELWGVWGTGGRDVLLDGLGCFAEAWARTPDSLQLIPTSPAGFARSLDTLKVQGAINTRAQGCQRGRPARGVGAAKSQRAFVAINPVRARVLSVRFEKEESFNSKCV